MKQEEGKCRAVSPDEVELGACVTSDRNLTDSDGITERNSMTQLKCLRVAGPQDSVFFSFPPSRSSAFLCDDLFDGGKIVFQQWQSFTLSA